ncbi:hypothetical protein QBC38DRAFT_454036 [Podospora fimiseda]|uniref:Uncharacterized protein n=1 Tax=Podospora fimiseda TaxID=252190 RepID=A0AAN7GWS9_9PEZI|nr:hypothetical protein QBC38DRAFT_454036 [Podospora fimiseda]
MTTQCANNQTTCSQGGWCCNSDETCSFDNAFFCCPAGTSLSKSGCRRVCAEGDFECGSICCAVGQTFINNDGLSPYCIHATTTINSIIASTVSASSRPTRSPSLTSIATNTTPTPATASPPTTAATTTTTTTSHSSGGFPKSAQTSVGIIVPLFVLMFLGCLWFGIFRNRFSSSFQSRDSSSMPRRSRSRLGELNDTFYFPRRSAAGSPPPTYLYPNRKMLDLSTMSVHERYILESSKPIAPPRPIKLQTLRHVEDGEDKAQV